MEMGAFYENQQQAICHNDGPMLVVAGPGSGKTTVIVHRVKHLISAKGVPPEKILVITFTKAAATQMKNRFLALSDGNGSAVTFATFHSLFFRILRSVYNYTTEQILSEDEKWRLIKGFISEFDIQTNDKEEAVRCFFSALSLLKSDMANLATFEPEGLPKEDFAMLYKAYEGYKDRTERIDFDDMLTYCYHLINDNEKVRRQWRNRFNYILIDEFQDANRAQYETIKLLASPLNNIFAVGDDDQSIYAFRGARPDLLLAFKTDYPNAVMVTLNRNFRSTEKIVKLSEKIISHNGKRLPKNMISANSEGKKTTLLTNSSTAEEGRKIVEKIGLLHEEGIQYSQMAIICRTNIQGGLYAGLLGNRGIPYILKDKGINPWSHWITQDILAYLSLAQNSESNDSLMRIINKPKRYISKVLISEASELPYKLLDALPLCQSLKTYQGNALKELRGHLGEIRKKSPHDAIAYIRKTVGYDSYLQEYATFSKANIHGYIEIAEEATAMAAGVKSVEEYIAKIRKMDEQITNNSKRNAEPTEGVTVSTMHSAKGLEFYAVFIPSIVEGVLPHEKSLTPELLEEERRLFYVAVTRAKEILYLSQIKTRYEKNTTRSRFLKELGIK